MKATAIAQTAPKRDLLSIVDVQDRIEALLDHALALKRSLGRHGTSQAAKGRHLGLLFEKPSTRTRLSFEVGFKKLGGDVVQLSKNDLQLGRGETIRDTAKVLSRFLDAIMYRAFKAEDVRELARHATVPVLNGLDDEEHPCQALADFLTVREHFGKLRGLEFAYVGDGDNNVAHSYLLGAPLAGMNVRILSPPDYQPRPAYAERARRLAAKAKTTVTVGELSPGALKGADVVATDTWVSMGDEQEERHRLRAFEGYTVTHELLAQTGKPSTRFLHCLPAHYGQEVDEKVAHGPQSLVFEEAENRMWAQMALLADLLHLKA